MIGKLNHVAIVVPDLTAAAELYRSSFGAEVSEPVDLPEQGVTTVFVNLPNTKIELLHPLGDGSPVEKFLVNNPRGGMHHVCYEVTDLEGAIAKLRAKHEPDNLTDRERRLMDLDRYRPLKRARLRRRRRRKGGLD